MLGAQIWETVSEWMVTAGERIMMSSPKESEFMDSHDPVLRSDDESAEEEKSVLKEIPLSEEEECGFCLFMKGGGCKDAFMDWDNCCREAEKEEEDVTKKCADMTDAMIKCMLVHSEYYEPLLQVEKAMKEEALRVLEKEAAPSEGSDFRSEDRN